MQSPKEVFLALVRLGIGHSAGILPEAYNWDEIQALANAQGLSAIVFDGVEKLPDGQKPPKPVLLQWIGETLQVYEYHYDAYKKVIAEMAAFYNSHGYKMMVLKGYACSIDWPKPEHRPCGDIDIWLFGRQKEADAALTAWFKGLKVQEFKVDNSHHHHTVFYWNDFMVENHYDFVNVYARKSSVGLEKIFKELGDEANLNLDSAKGMRIPCVEVNGEKVYLPSPNLHALFLMRHMVSHFVGSNITLRQVLDWAFFVEKHTKEINWEWLLSIVDGYHMRDFYNCINAICVEDLGFPVEIFRTIQFEPGLKGKVLNDILSPEFETQAPKMLIRKIIFKYRRWQGNAWKQRMCYNESRWSAFWTGVWAKLLKPASI